jgi:prepilin-type N-terminal cleavage/methylation domain-containing protein
MKEGKNSQKGFTLIELLVVIAIISLLASVVYGAIQQAQIKAQNASYLEKKNAVIQAMNLYYNDHGSYPQWPAGWVCIGPSSVTCWGSGFSGNDAFWAMLQPYFSGIPTTGAVPGTFAYNFFKYNNAGTFAPQGVTGAFFVWVKSTTITAGECPWPGDVVHSAPPYDYCYYYLGQ